MRDYQNDLAASGIIIWVMGGLSPILELLLR